MNPITRPDLGPHGHAPGKDSILTGEGLYNTLRNRRAFVHKEFVCRSHVVYKGDQIIGHIFTKEEFQTFLHVAVQNDNRRRAAADMFEKFARSWGATGHKVFPIELVDGLLDMLSKE